MSIQTAGGNTSYNESESMHIIKRRFSILTSFGAFNSHLSVIPANEQRKWRKCKRTIRRERESHLFHSAVPFIASAEDVGRIWLKSPAFSVPRPSARPEQAIQGRRVWKHATDRRSVAMGQIKQKTSESGAVGCPSDMPPKSR